MALHDEIRQYSNAVMKNDFASAEAIRQRNVGNTEFNRCAAAVDQLKASVSVPGAARQVPPVVPTQGATITAEAYAT